LQIYVLHFHALLLGPSISCPAISCPAFSVNPNFQRHCYSKLVVQEAELHCTPLWGTDHKSGGTLYPHPSPVAPLMPVSSHL